MRSHYLSKTKMLYKESKRTRQSPLQKAIGYGEDALKVIGTGRAIYDAGRTVWGAAQAVAPYAQAAIAML